MPLNEGLTLQNAQATNIHPRQRGVIRAGVIALCLGIAVSTGALAWQEFLAIKSTRLSSSTLILNAANDAPRPPIGLGYRTRTAQLDNCALAQTELIASLMPQRYMGLLAEDCILTADEALKGMPAFGVAQVAKAASFATLGDVPKLREALIASQLASPYEGWLAGRRLALAAAQYEKLDDATRSALANDIAVLAGDAELVGSLAALYVRFEPARSWIENVVETQDESVQASFLRALRSAGR